MNILLVYPFLLTKNVMHGSGVQLLRMIEGIHKNGYNIYLICISEQDFDINNPEISYIRSLCVEMLIVRRNVLSSFDKLKSFIKIGLPPHARNLLNTEVADFIRIKTFSSKIQVVIFFTTDSGVYFPFVDKSKSLIVADTQEIPSRHYLYEVKNANSLKELLHTSITYFREKMFEKKYFNLIDLVITISSNELSYILKYSKPKNYLIIPTLIDTSQTVINEIDVEENTLLFFGSFNHKPNVDAIKWFCKFIYPLIVKEISNVKLYIVGNYSKEKVGYLGSKNILVIGKVEDIRIWIKKTAIVISPIISGGGSRLKNIETLLHGKPLVTTTIGSEGIELKTKEGYFIEDNPSKFAVIVVNLLKDTQLREKMGIKGIQYAKDNHDNLLLSSKLLNKLNELYIKKFSIQKLI